ncbi:MAG: helix-turn-helix domain-containing protein [Spirochaetales bacterium]|nr:helix-turn-helix domain-containing protein [Spirochaetales bacterium]
MESIGDRLRVEREQKGYTIEQIARDTNIARRYLEALEAEDFSVFPGDPYLIGFLRNYSDYLGIDPDEMVKLYNNFKIQSQPVPMDELIVKRDRKPLFIGAAIVVAAAGLAVLGYFVVPGIVAQVRERRAQRDAAVVEETSGGTVYTLEGEMIERRFLEKDVIRISHKDEIFEIQLTDIGDRLNLTIPGGTLLLRLGDERAIDLDGDSNMDIRVAVNDLLTGVKQKSAVLRFDMFVRTTGKQVSAPASEQEPSGPDVEGTGLESRAAEPSVILEAQQAEPFRVNVSFRGYCLFRYLVDGRDRVERYFQRGDTVILDVTRKVVLWMSNAGNVSARVANREVRFGNPGEVSTSMISWNGGQDGEAYTLLVQAIY